MVCDFFHFYIIVPVKVEIFSWLILKHMSKYTLGYEDAAEEEKTLGRLVHE